MHRQTDTDRHRQAGKQTDTDRQASRQTDRHKHTHLMKGLQRASMVLTNPLACTTYRALRFFLYLHACTHA